MNNIFVYYFPDIQDLNKIFDLNSAMEAEMNDALTKLCGSAGQLAAIDVCIEEGEFGAARKLLKRHGYVVDDSAKKIKLFVHQATAMIRTQRVKIAAANKEIILLKLASQVNGRSSSNSGSSSNNCSSRGSNSNSSSSKISSRGSSNNSSRNP